MAKQEALTNATIRDDSGQKVVGKTIAEVKTQQFGFLITFTDGSVCDIWSNPDDEMFLRLHPPKVAA
jgi:hypothetical protein